MGGGESTAGALVRRTLLLAALSSLGCGVGRAPRADAGAATASSAAPSARQKPAFACGARPACPAERPHGARPLVDAVRAADAAGEGDRAAALVACARDDGLDVRVDVDPGFSVVSPSPDGKYLLADLSRDGVLRVFDATTWKETLRLDDVGRDDGALGGLALVADRAASPHTTLWDLAAQAPIALTVPAGVRAGVSAEGSVVFWAERAPHPALAVVIARDPSKVVRFAVDLGAEPRVAELPGGRLVASASDGRHAVLDLGTGGVVRTFAAPRSTIARLAGPDRNVAVLDVGESVAGFDDLYFGPSRPPVAVPLAGSAPPKPLTGPGCTRSRVAAVSDDGALAITRAKEAWCLFDVTKMALLGSVGISPHYRVAPLATSGVFVGSGLAVVAIGQAVFRLGVDPGKTPALVDLGDLEGEATILEPSGAVGLAVAPPHERVWVGLREQGGERTITEVRADGGMSSRPAVIEPVAHVLGAPWVDPGGVHIIGFEKLESIRACLLAPPGTCRKLPLGGSFRVAPDGAWAAGPIAIGPFLWTSPAFSGRHGGLAIVDVASGRELYRHFAPGFASAAFTSEKELALFGEDGTLMSCSLDARSCVVAGAFPSATTVLTEPGALVVADGRTIASIPPTKPGIRADVVTPPPPPRGPDRDVLLSQRGLLVKATSDTLDVVDATTGEALRKVPFGGRALFAAAAATPRVAAVSDAEVAVVDVETGARVFSHRLPRSMLGPGGAVATNADGSRVALVQDGALVVYDATSSKPVGRWRIDEAYPRAVGLSADGRWAATIVEVAGEHVLLIGDVRAPAKLERLRLGPVTERSGYGVATIAVANGGSVAATFVDGRAILVGGPGPQGREWFDLARDAADSGVWLRARDGRNESISALGKVAPTSRGVGCRIGAWVVPLAACLPSSCAPR